MVVARGRGRRRGAVTAQQVSFTGVAEEKHYGRGRLRWPHKVKVSDAPGRTADEGKVARFLCVS